MIYNKDSKKILKEKLAFSLFISYTLKKEKLWHYHTSGVNQK